MAPVTKPLPFSSEVPPLPVIHQRSGGGVEFTCTECGLQHRLSNTDR